MIIQINATVCGFWIMVRAGSTRSLAAITGSGCRQSTKGGVARGNEKFRELGSNAGSWGNGTRSRDAAL